MLQRTAVQFIPPVLPTLVKERPAGDKWLHEIKHEGRAADVLEFISATDAGIYS